MRIALLGFGEVGQRLAHDLVALGRQDVCVWDIQFQHADSKPSRAVADAPVRAAASAADALTGATLVLSAVTADQALAAATDAAAHLEPGSWYLDLNSVAPATRQAAASAVHAAQGRYVEAAVMAPIEPLGLASPMLLGGPHAAAFDAASHGLRGARLYSEQIGPASAAKLCRSIIVKGMEALCTEALLAARHYGVEATVLESLGGLLPHPDWASLSHYLIGRSVEHGQRRADELREAARTVATAGVTSWMADAIVSRQEWAAHRIPPAATLTGQLDNLLGTP